MFEGLLSPMHLVIICVIALVVLGPKRLPEAGRGLGRSMREFKSGISGISDGDSSEKPAKTDAKVD